VTRGNSLASLSFKYHSGCRDGGWFSVAIMAFVTPTKLSYVEPS